jgi:photosystem II stability/assembly factor-like uncharacterized protein
MTRLMAATGDSVARLTETASGWQVELALPGSGAQCLAADPRDPDHLLAGCRGQGVWRSVDGGATWQDTSLPAPDVFAVAIGVDGALYAGCEPSMLFRSEDGGTTWEELAALRELPSAPSWSFPPRPWTSHVRWIAPSPHDGSLLLVGIELGGLMRSEDGGATWADHRPGAQPDVHSLAWHPHVPGRAYEAGGGGAAWSFDAGATWQPADEGRDRHYTWALAVDPEDPDCWFVSASTGPYAAHGRGEPEANLYRWRGAGPWERLNGGLPAPLDSMPYALGPVGARLFAAFANGALYVSEDRGETWRRLELLGDSLPRVVAIVGSAG